MSAARSKLKRLSFRTFLLLDRAGIHVLPKHYYSPLPDYAWLRENEPLWRRRAPLRGVAWDLDRQLVWLRETCGAHYAEVAGLDTYERLTARGLGPGYGPIESQVLHCFVRARAPRRVVEIGGGVSTAIMDEAARANAAEERGETTIITIEPFARPALASLPRVQVVRQRAQEVALEIFDELAAGDLLFIDSTHAVKTGSEVVRLYLEVVPRLAPGVTVHVHDVYLPYLYSRTVLSSYFDWQESSLVLALLTGNEHLRVACCLSALHYDRTQALRTILGDYQPQPDLEGIALDRSSGHFPSSLWLETA